MRIGFIASIVQYIYYSAIPGSKESIDLCLHAKKEFVIVVGMEVFKKKINEDVNFIELFCKM